MSNMSELDARIAEVATAGQRLETVDNLRSSAESLELAVTFVTNYASQCELSRKASELRSEADAIEATVGTIEWRTVTWSEAGQGN